MPPVTTPGISVSAAAEPSTEQRLIPTTSIVRMRTISVTYYHTGFLKWIGRGDFVKLELDNTTRVIDSVGEQVGDPGFNISFYLSIVLASLLFIGLSGRSP